MASHPREILILMWVWVVAGPAVAADPSDAIYSDETVARFDLTIAAADWDEIVNDPAGEGDTWQRATMTWTNGVETDVVDGVGVKRSGRGTQALVTPKPAIRISFNEFEYDAAKRKWRGVNRVKLDSMIGNTDHTMMRDRIAYRIFREFGAAAPRATHGRLYVNGVYKGLYTVEEPVRKPFVAYRWGEDRGNLYDRVFWKPYVWLGADPAAYVPSRFAAETNYPGGDYSDLVELIDSLNNVPADQIRARLEARVNMDSFYYHVAAMIAVGDGDGLAHWSAVGCSNNHWWYHRQQTDRFEIIKWDPGASLGLYDVADGFALGESPLFNQFQAPPITKWILNDAVAQATIKTRIGQILNGPFARAPGWIDAIYAQIRDAAYADPNKGVIAGADADGFSNADFDAATATLKDWFTRRAAFLRTQIGVTAKNEAQFVAQTVPTDMSPKAVYPVSVTMKNAGAVTWAEASYRLGSALSENDTLWGLNRVALAAGSSIGSDQEATFEWTVTAPATPGTYTFAWRMRQSGVEWFGESTPVVTVTVKAEDPGADADGDGLPDGWEREHFGTLQESPAGDFDTDGLANIDEHQAATDPTSPDTDGDGMTDSAEVVLGLEPTVADQDKNGCLDGDDDWDRDGVMNRTDPSTPGAWSRGHEPLPDPAALVAGCRSHGTSRSAWLVVLCAFASRRRRPVRAGS
ncbi:MAG: CotH kinase family protein [Deltaproteobacteria bacterium]|nr:CotH kinase family protein [Deltaproteobacteria bacterium]